MIQKLSDMALAVYLVITGEIKSLKRDERGLSGVVVAVLLILVAVLAVVLIWGFLSGWLAKLWDDIMGNAGKIV